MQLGTKIRNYKLELFLKFWLLFFFVTSIVLLPQVKGTTPAFVLAFLSAFLFIFFSKYLSIKFFFLTGVTALSILLIFLASQALISLYSFESNLPQDVIFISEDSSLLFKASFFTQYLYLIASIIIFYFVMLVFDPTKHDPYIYAGTIALLIYGFYEIIYFQATGEFGDFLTNRVFGEKGMGSALQTISISGFTTQRFKSLTGEPSMYVFSVFPVFIYAYENGKKTLSYLILVSMIFTFSTTFVLGFSIFLAIKFIKRGFQDRFVISTIIILVLCIIFFFPEIYVVLEQVIIDKINGNNYSGSERSGLFFNHLNYFSEFPFPIKLFGLGFGYVRSTDFFSTLLVNVGIVGFLVYSLLFFYPMLKLGKTKRERALKVILFFIYFASLVSVPEFSYPSTWLFLGISYNLIRRNETTTIPDY